MSNQHTFNGGSCEVCGRLSFHGNMASKRKGELEHATFPRGFASDEAGHKTATPWLSLKNDLLELNDPCVLEISSI